MPSMMTLLVLHESRTRYIGNLLLATTPASAVKYVHFFERLTVAQVAGQLENNFHSVYIYQQGRVSSSLESVAPAGVSR